MMFRNMETLGVHSVKNVVKVGDTVADIKEGIAAGAVTVGVIEGSSAMGFSQASYEALSETERQIHIERTRQVYLDAGADFVIMDMSGLPELVSGL